MKSILAALLIIGLTISWVKSLEVKIPRCEGTSMAAFENSCFRYFEASK